MWRRGEDAVDSHLPRLSICDQFSVDKAIVFRGLIELPRESRIRARVGGRHSMSW